MSDTKITKELYGLYVQRFGNCPRTPYQAEFYRKWLDLLNECSSNEEAEEKSKENGLYTGGAAAVALDRVVANKQAAQELGWTDVAEFCDEIIGKIKADPYYTFTHSSLWIDLQAKKDGWIRTIEGFQRLFVDFMEYDDARNDAQRALASIAEDAKMLSKPSSDFATLAAMPSFRAMIDCSDEYYREFTDTVSKAIATGYLDTIQWSAESRRSEIDELWDKKDTLTEECRHWYSQEVKKPTVRLSPETADGKYKLIEIE
ncbi:MAG: hypothetical protein IJK74_04005 [Bacteroidales bacterium]|nr:hypothetical protein [Bacteroidales bacterium]